MLAMRNKSTFFILASLIIWTTISYFFIFYQNPMKRNEVSFLLQITQLESEVNDLLLSNLKIFQNYKNSNLRNFNLDKIIINSSSKDTLYNKIEYRSPEDLSVKLNSRESKFDEQSSHFNVNHIPIDIFSQDKRNLSDGSPIIAVLVISCNRITVQRCLDQLIKYRPSKNQFPIIVSQDCGHQRTSDEIKKFGKKIKHIEQPDQSEIEVPLREKKFSGYFKIARHYGWALNQIFFNYTFESVIVVEDDLDISPDFFEYFLGTYPLLRSDPSLWCISAWNDNGKSNLIDQSSPHLLYRTDFFPGLGWMLTRNLWLELSPKWPKSYWDDWIRQPEQRRNRACIRPEISRTRTFGKIGVSNGLFYEKHLQYIKLNNKVVPFTKKNLTFLIKENYDIVFVNEVYKSRVVKYSELKTPKYTNESVRIPYYTRQSYKNIAKMVGLMDDFKSGVPRTGYRGIVTFYFNNQRVYLAPSPSWSKYDISWS